MVHSGHPDSLSELGTLIPVNPSHSTSGKDSCLVLALEVDITYIFLVRYSHSEVYPLLFSVIMVGCFFYDHQFRNFFALTILSLTCYPLMYLLIQFYPVTHLYINRSVHEVVPCLDIRMVDFHTFTLQLPIQTLYSVAPELPSFCEFT